MRDLNLIETSTISAGSLISGAADTISGIAEFFSTPTRQAWCSGASLGIALGGVIAATSGSAAFCATPLLLRAGYDIYNGYFSKTPE